MSAARYCARCLTTFADDAGLCPNLACGVARPAHGWGDVLGPNDVLDRHYQIVKPLAIGGAGLTYLARELGPDGAPVGPELAIKVLYAQRDRGAFLHRLATEAQILQQLDHPHIVSCRGFVQRAGHPPYLVTAFEHGGSLWQHVERYGALSAAVTAGILRQVLLALDVAHRRGIVHRDLKPDNVLLTASCGRDELPHVKVTDFGIAKVLGGLTSETRLGTFLGTPEFAAPEQFRAETPTPAADLFAAGAMLAFLRFGRTPFVFSDRLDADQSLTELLAAIPPRLPGDDPGDAELQAFVNATLRPRPSQRPSVHEAIAILEHLLPGTSVLTTLDPPAPPTAELPTERPAPHRASDGADLPPTSPAMLGLAGFASFAVVLVLGLVLIAALGIGAIVLLSGRGGAPEVETVRELPYTDPEFEALRGSLAREATPAVLECGLTGDLRLTLEIDASGHVRRMVLEEGALQAERAACLGRVFEAAALPRTSSGTVRIEVDMGFGDPPQ